MDKQELTIDFINAAIMEAASKITEEMKLPWSLPYDPALSHHLPIRSQTQDGLVAYYQTVEKLIKGTRTPIKPGRYLQKYYKDVFDAQEITRMASEFLGGVESMKLCFVEPVPVNATPEFIKATGKEWVRVYKSAVRSCMAGQDAVRVYAYPGNGIGLAYLEEAGSIVARSVVGYDNGEPAGYVRCYGTSEHTMVCLGSLLNRAGFEHNPDVLRNRELNRIDEGGSIVCPYLDGDYNGIDVYANHLYITDCGEYTANQTCGYLEDNGAQCDCCEEYFDEDDLTRVYGGDHICDGCLRDEYVRAYTACTNREYVHQDDVIRCESNDRYYLDDSWLLERLSIVRCEHSCDYYFERDCVAIDGDWYALQYCRELDIKDEEGNSHALTGDAELTDLRNWVLSDELIDVAGYNFHPDELQDEALLNRVLALATADEVLEAVADEPFADEVAELLESIREPAVV